MAAGDVDISLGVDEGGSARIPASWCGVVCIKATHGLVPSFGISYLDHTIDYICPTASTVRDVALTLGAIAGDDPRDPQWVRGPIQVADYGKELEDGVSGLRIGIITESLDWTESEADVNEAVRAAVGKLQASGATIEDVSLPWWRDFWPVLYGILSHSASAMVQSDMEGYWRGGSCDPAWQEAFGKARRAGSNGFPALLKVWMVLGEYLRREYCSIYFSKAQNLRLALAEQMDRAFQQFDLLVSPTTPMKAIRLTEKVEEGKWAGRGAVDMNRNTCPTNLTGHPALSVPCGFGANGLPIGLQLMGRRWEENTLFRAAYTYAEDRSFAISS